MSKIFSAGFWRLYQLIIDSSMPKGGVDIFSCNQKIRDNLISFKESNSSLVSLLFWLGYRRTFAPYERKARLHGKSAWTFSKKLRYLNNTMYGFTDFPIRLITWAGSFVSILSLCLMLFVFVAKIFGFIDPPGYTTIVLLISFFGASNIVAIGIVGGYIYRCFENTKARPLFVIQHQESFRID